MSYKTIFNFLVILGILLNTSIALSKPNNSKNQDIQLVQKSPKFRVLEEPRLSDSFRNPLSYEQSYFNGQEQNEQFPRFTANRNRRNRRPVPKGPNRRQDGPGLNITNVSPIELSLGGLTGLQGLPPLSILQFIKLLIAVTPFIIPLIFVPLLIFTLGMFMIPVKKPNIFLGDDGLGFPKSSSSTSSSWTWLSSLQSNIVPSLTNFAKSFANHEECIERLICELGKKYIPEENDTMRNGYKNFSSSSRRIVLQRLLEHFNHPLMNRISKSLQVNPISCGMQRCSPASFLQKLLIRE